MANRTHTPLSPGLMVSLLIPVKHIPDGEVVTKPTGTVSYTVLREFRPHVTPEAGSVFLSPMVLGDGTVLLLGSDGSGLVVPDDYMVKIKHRIEDLHEYLAEVMEESRAR